MKNLINIEILNTVLILVSLLLAYCIPFELFVFAYAILGPLHYLTELNWIRDRQYFLDTKHRWWVWVVFGAALLVSLPIVLHLEVFSGFNTSMLSFMKDELPKYTNVFIFLALVLSFVLLFVKNKSYQYLIIIGAVVIGILLNDLSAYNLWIGIFLPTLLHVYLFTLLFMWYGSLKANAKLGKLNVVLLAVVPFLIAFLNVDFITYNFPDAIKTIILENRFFMLNVRVAEFLGLSDGTSFFFYEKIELKIQIFIAFAYMYHYLNWFSKTTVIGWHKQLTKRKSLLILVLWMASISIYFYDYKVGLALLLMLSFAHVFAEFPLNWMSVKGIYASLIKSSTK
jgi:hypothetical protein